MKGKLAIALAFLVAAGCGVYWYFHRGVKLTEADSIVVADFNNSTGETVFDGSLKEALQVALAQSPFLNLVSDERVSETLRHLGHASDDRLTADLVRAVCERAGARAFLVGGIARGGEGYKVTLEASQCGTNEVITRVESEAASRDGVVRALGSAAVSLRQETGESEDSIQKFNVALDRATSPSLEALKLYAEGRKLTREKGALDGVAPLKKAVELDPRFAMAYSSLAVDHYNLNQNALAGDEIRQAFGLGDRQTAREHVQITTLYYDLGTGDVQKAIANYQEWAKLYPRDDVARGNLSSEYFLIGDYEHAAEAAQLALRLEPESLAWYENLSTADIALMRLEDAQSVLKEAFAKKFDDPSLHANMYALAFLRDDNAGMDREVAAGMGKPGGEDMMLALEADTEAFHGRQKKARELSRRAVESAQKAELAEPAAIWAALAAVREAEFGNTEEAKKRAAEVLKLAPNSRDARTLATFVFAGVGDHQRSQALLDDLQASYVTNTLVQQAWVPMIHAQEELLGAKPARAVELLRPVVPYENGELIGNLSNCCMLPVYMRGQAYLKAGQGVQALREFQKILDSKGVVVNCWAGALAKLGEARSQALAGYTVAARSAYQEFFSLWKDADPDVPVLKAARAEYARLK